MTSCLQALTSLQPCEILHDSYHQPLLWFHVSPCASSTLLPAQVCCHCAACQTQCGIDIGLHTGCLRLLVLMASVPLCCRYLHQGRVASWSIGAWLVLNAL